MSTTTAPRLRAAGTTPAQSNAFTGTMDLLRFILHRDRIRFPAWVLGITMLVVYVSNAIGFILDDTTMQSFAIMASNPIMGLIGGPGYGFEHISVPLIIVGIYGLYIMLATALMSITTISRHTRIEEQTGRAELIRANVVGRHAQLTATLIVVAAMNILTSFAVAGAFYFSEARPDSLGPVLLFSTSVGAAGLVFGGVAAITAQLSPYSRTGSGIAGIVLAIAFVIRGLGDMSAIQHGNLTWLSWLSPLGWSQQTALSHLGRYIESAILLRSKLPLAEAQRPSLRTALIVKRTMKRSQTMSDGRPWQHLLSSSYLRTAMCIRDTGKPCFCSEVSSCLRLKAALGGAPMRG